MSDFRVQVVRANGTRRRTLTKPPFWSLDAQWSPDGKLLSFTRMPAYGNGSNGSVWVVRPNGTGLRRLAGGQSARWSPDGGRLVLSDRGGDLVVVRADGHNHLRLSATPVLEQPAGWSPDGKRILFTRWPSGSDNSDVFVMDADGTHVRRLTRFKGEDVAGAWSPDGAQILFTSKRTGRSQLFLMRADGSRQHRLFRSSADAFEPSWR